MPSRRRVLGLAAAALTTTSGCVAAPVSGGAPVADVHATRPQDGKTRGEADPISVERTVTDADYEYLPSNDTVRYPATMSGGEVDNYGYAPFEKWADVETLSVAAQAVRNRFAQRFENTRFVSAGISNPEGEPLQVSVSHRTLLDESGDVIGKPDVSVSRLVEATPSSITATVGFSGQTATRTHPAFVVWDAHVPLAVREENDSE
ncbi:hypothetical protein [Halobacterium zhouii]|uniref:hypothetical protein n=1 Tax=Halobacterium zhouii TaxID=2902624 RepID=UPI001E4F1CE2|nr:hypothetical protein [Halobacterium zhouii]